MVVVAGCQRAVRRSPRRLNTRRPGDHSTKFRAREAAEHRRGPIVSRDMMKAQRKRQKPEPTGRDPAPTQIAHDDGVPSHAIQLGDDDPGFFGGEMVEQL